mmetsp:Transcript_8045/g.21326  ORF Transcript_8045/g.21326 Transcript_8045/m.21326 type:complete len:106 (-) Transcript_8045:330-647(-)|eukprot:CAMPEP_0185832526 /NCGR_PEP_ID=MMETSP1353-20130828/2133_1 /TAXON_ID=1077150 /ORGANISM="Erythrolobus australicus, Strain CCMP3124" /LENGTH=105 /DNA_ID=CAMNT_0028530705 /DNA_START=16 /DNA_END=333 /DNA_ORIENTATION=+
MFLRWKCEARGVGEGMEVGGCGDLRGATGSYEILKNGGGLLEIAARTEKLEAGVLRIPKRLCGQVRWAPTEAHARRATARTPRAVEVWRCVETMPSGNARRRGVR